MNPLPITAQQIVRVVLIFVGVIIGFGVLRGTLGWPDQQSWGLAVFAALLIALLPFVGPLLAYLRESGAVIDIRGVKLDFSRVPRSRDAEPRHANLQEVPGMLVTDSNAVSIAEAVETALHAEIIVVNLGTGRSWYPSRLFALAVAADKLSKASIIVLLLQRGGVERHLLGWLHPPDVIRAMIQNDGRYRLVLDRAMAMLRQLEMNVGVPNPAFPPAFPFTHDLILAYQSTGDRALVPALIHELQEPPPPAPPIEDRNTAPSWLTGEDAERIFNPWLIRKRLSAAATKQEAMMTLAEVPHRFIAMEENGQYVGMANIDAFVRQLVLRPAVEG